tara:strand:- start:2771 stop:2977 length:207 start_codon:yes stop_codon:yes gene_type:complete
MEKQKSNVIPFRRETKPTVEEKQVRVLMCSLCGSNVFHLVTEEEKPKQEGGISCAECGFLIGSTWKNK